MRGRTELVSLVLVCVACGGEIEGSTRDGAVQDGGARNDASTDASTDAVVLDASNGSADATSDAAQDAAPDAAQDAAQDASQPDASVSGEPPALVGITSQHNMARANATPTPSPALGQLTWSNTLASAAQAWANNCEWEHSGNGYGENLYALSVGTGATAQSVVADWVSEAANYNYAGNTCSGVCGHYTQVVWRSTTQLGCGVATCNTGRPFSGTGPWQLVVCDYSPPGNNGARPY